ncbi:enoyl-CoA hydratase-related protein [Virgisporangium aurantiacum]|uniref:Enoyl-CoA hydratase n=1 Tax=Virgisporangium aurantiacum TaxID=175570 RepID=A0A8J3Z4T1_9ACTN|nr:enoyl-CoA hydratase-related protein [Virgisporangium aurantiacum]GIJ56313.1 enoyl-CoA hydratase [Virgisporangium aurantiacum]
MTTTVTLAVDAGLARITLDGPTTRNALDGASAQALVDACAAVDADATVGVAVITGAGGAFCSGAARGTLAALADAPADRMYDELGAVYRAFERVGRLAVPTIARIEGAAVGAGLNLALATDLRLAAPGARLISGFAAIGIHPGGGHLHLLARTAGRQAAAALGVFACPLTALEAKAAGLIWDVAADGDLDALVDAAAAPLRADPELARALKTSLQLTTSGVDAWSAATEVERARQMWSLTRKAAR